MKEMNGAARPSSEIRSVQRTISGVRYSLHQVDCLDWMDRQGDARIHAIVTDPPYGLKEFTASEKEKASPMTATFSLPNQGSPQLSFVSTFIMNTAGVITIMLAEEY